MFSIGELPLLETYAKHIYIIKAHRGEICNMLI